MTKEQGKIAYFRGNFAKNCIRENIVQTWQQQQQTANVIEKNDLNEVQIG